MSRFITVALLICTGCASTSSTDDGPPSVYFPRLADEERPFASSRLEGVVSLVDRCLRVVNEADGFDYLIVWAPWFELDGVPPEVSVIDARSGRAVRVGDRVVVGGSGGSSRDVEGLEGPLPPECPGDVWVAGEVAPG